MKPPEPDSLANLFPPSPLRQEGVQSATEPSLSRGFPRETGDGGIADPGRSSRLNPPDLPAVCHKGATSPALEVPHG